MLESAADPAPNPYITSKEDEVNANRLKPDVAHQVYLDIRREAERLGLEIESSDSPEEKERKNQALKDLFDARSASDLPDYQAVQIVDNEGQADRDPLTGLLNRRGFEKQFNEFLRQPELALFLMIDLDDFKPVNDKFGHPVGDQTLKYLARGLTDSVEIGDLVGRWGGEEFVIAIKIKSEQSDDAADLFGIAERVRLQAVDFLDKARYLLASGGDKDFPISITLSVGATLTKSGDTLETICQRTDDNLYKAKRNGRNQSIGDNGKIELPS